MTPLFAQASLTDPSHLGVLIGTIIGVAALMLGIRVLGLVLAATHPDPAPATSGRSKAATTQSIPEHHVLAVIAAATHETLGKPHRILSVSPVAPPSVESLMLQWSMEGRRAIYSSHRLR